MAFDEIQLRDINLAYPAKNEQNHILSHIDLNIKKGEFFSLLGPSGCGKTTILRLIADLLRPSSGEVAVAGMSPHEARKQHKCAVVFQSPVLYEWRTVKENIALPLELIRKDKKQRNQIVKKQLERVYLDGNENRYPRELSGGMQQRVGIARALALDPEIILMDEPFSALDEFTRLRLNEDLLQIWSETAKTIVFVTHNIAEAVFLSDRVGILSANPARISSIVDIQLPRPRTRAVYNTQEFFEASSKIRRAFNEDFNENI